DPQANLTAGLGINLNTVERSMAVVLADGRAKLSDVIIATESAGIDVAPAHIDLASTEGELFTELGREAVLREAIDGQTDGYDYVLIDCPPNLGLLTVNGLVAANGVIIPVQTQYYAMKGLTNLVKVINAIRLKLNRDLRILGLLPTFYDGRTNLARDMPEERELSPAIVSLLTPDSPTRSVGVRIVPTDHIEPNPEQPRLAFNQETL